jgi:Ran GTPase-activating protein (RanGAP) involved in mRNA processing and transport
MEGVALIIIKKKEVKMPRGNGMGPQGQGPLTGKKMGNCAQSTNADSKPGLESVVFYGNRFGQGRGRRGFGLRGFFADNKAKAQIQEEATLRNEIASLHSQIAMLEKKIDDLIKTN